MDLSHIANLIISIWLLPILRVPIKEESLKYTIFDMNRCNCWQQSYDNVRKANFPWLKVSIFQSKWYFIISLALSYNLIFDAYVNKEFNLAGYQVVSTWFSPTSGHVTLSTQVLYPLKGTQLRPLCLEELILLKSQADFKKQGTETETYAQMSNCI